MAKFTEEQLLLRAAAHEFAEKHFSLEEVLKDEEKGKVRDSVLMDAHKQGFTSAFVPQENGAFAYDTVSLMMIAERLCKSPSGAINLVGPGLPLAAILRAGSPQQKAEIQKAMAAGEMPARFAFALTEPGVGSDATQIRTKAVNDGDYFVLNGTKAFITGAGYVKEAAERGYAVVMAQVFDIGNKRGIRGFIVRGDNPGYQIGKPYDKMGLHASDTREVILDNCRVHKDAMLGINLSMEELLRVTKTTLDTSRPFVAALALGIASAAYDRALEAAQTRQIRGRPLIQFQAIRHTLAEIRVDLEAVAQLTYSTGRTLDKIFRKELEQFPDEEGSMAKYLAADTAVQVCRRALEVFGGDGYMNEMGMSLYSNAASVFPIWEGTENIQLQTIAGKGKRKLKPRDPYQNLREKGGSFAGDYQIVLDASFQLYNAILNFTQNKTKEFDENQAVQFTLAKMRSKLEAAFQLGEYAESVLETIPLEEQLAHPLSAIATVYARKTAADILKYSTELIGVHTTERDFSHEMLHCAETLSNYSILQGPAYKLLDQIAGTENNFLLKPSSKWYPEAK